VQHKRDGAAAEDADWQKFAAEVLTRPESATAEQLTVFARLDSRRRRRPSDPNRLLPTQIGSILRAAETRPADRYGLDAVVVWPSRSAMTGQHRAGHRSST
jgi:hypothetical protein